MSPLQNFAADVRSLGGAKAAESNGAEKSGSLDLPTASEEYVKKIKARLQAVDGESSRLGVGVVLACCEAACSA